MKLKGTSNSNRHGLVFSTGIGVGTAVIISVIGAAIVTSLIINETAAVSIVKILAFVIQFLSTVIGGLIACTITKGKFALTAGITAIFYCFVLAATSVLIYDSMFGRFWISLLSICLGYVAACTICITKATGNGRRKRAHR